MQPSSVICKNCNTPYKITYNFCPNCGQRSSEELTLKVLFYNTITNYFAVDGRLFKSIGPLLIKPGYLAKNFIQGKYLYYLHPAQLYFFLSLIFFFLFSFVVKDQSRKLDNALHINPGQTKAAEPTLKKAIEDSIQMPVISATLNENDITDLNFNSKIIDSLIKEGRPDQEIYKYMGLKPEDNRLKKRLYTQALKFYKSRDGGSIWKEFADSIPIAMFILLPIFALILKLLFYKKGPYSYHLVFTFYYFAFLFFVFTILLILKRFLWHGVPDYLNWLILCSVFIYLTFAIKTFYNQKWLKTIFKTTIATALFLLLVLPSAILIMGIIAFMFY